MNAWKEAPGAMPMEMMISNTPPISPITEAMSISHAFSSAPVSLGKEDVCGGGIQCLAR